MPSKKTIPDGWEDYTPVGEPIDGTRFIAFRVPLHMGLCRKVAEEQRFTPTDLIETVEKKGFKLGLIIDLTFTTRYYNKEEFLSRDIQYEKVFTAGHVVPKKSVRVKFFSVVDSFLKENKDNDLLIGVHCTHGLNRTGYLICRYLIDNMKVLPDEAVIKFNKARGHDIERENYLEDLKLGVSTHELPDEEERDSPEKTNSSIADDSDTRQRFRRNNDRHFRGERSEGRQRPDMDSSYRNSSRWQERSHNYSDNRIPYQRGYNQSRYQDSQYSNYRHERQSSSYDRQSNSYYRNSSYGRRDDDYRYSSPANSYGQYGHQHSYESGKRDRHFHNSRSPNGYGQHPSRRNDQPRDNSRYGHNSYSEQGSIRGYQY